MTDVFQNMVESTSLLSLEVHKIRGNWTGRWELQYANHAQGFEVLLSSVPFRIP